MDKEKKPMVRQKLAEAKASPNQRQQHQQQHQQQQQQQQQQHGNQLEGLAIVEGEGCKPTVGLGVSSTSILPRGSPVTPDVKGLRRIWKTTEHEFRLHEITGDGNCLFRAISFIIWGTESRHRHLRSMVVNHIEKFWSEHKSLVLAEWSIRSLTDYTNYMNANGTFASELECIVATKLNKLNLSIYRRADPSGNLKRILHNEFGRRARMANLLFTGNNECGHYDVLLPLCPSR